MIIGPEHHVLTNELGAEAPDVDDTVREVQGNPWVPARVRISWFEAPEHIRIGDVWQLELRLRRPRGNSNPGVFDYESWLFLNRIAATGYVVDSVRNQLLQTGQVGAVDALRVAIVMRLRETVVEPDRAAVLAAISAPLVALSN